MVFTNFLPRSRAIHSLYAGSMVSRSCWRSLRGRGLAALRWNNRLLVHKTTRTIGSEKIETHIVFKVDKDENDTQGKDNMSCVNNQREEQFPCLAKRTGY